jgi:pimeloyl-ACP methyl ester carboxylesterase
MKPWRLRPTGVLRHERRAWPLSWLTADIADFRNFLSSAAIVVVTAERFVVSKAETVLTVIAVALAALIIANFVFQWIAERRNPPIGQFIECDGVRVHYIDRGKPDAPCVVLLHGNGTMIQDLTISGLVDLLARSSRVICLDRPGFGHSQRPRSRVWTATAQADLLVKLLDQLGVHNPVVFGHSWGTLVAIALALHKNYHIQALVLASGYYFPTPRVDVWMMSGPAVPVLGDLLRYTIAPITAWAALPSLLRKLFAPRSVPAVFRTEFPTSLMLRPKQLRAAAEESALLIPTAALLQSQYSNLNCPVRIFHGMEDHVIEQTQSRRLHDAIRGSVLRLVEETGHMVTYAEPHGIAEAVAALTIVQRATT